MSLNTGFYYDPIYLEHDTGEHPENAGRLEFLTQAMANNSKLDALQRMSNRKADLKEIEAVHGTDYIRSIEEACATGIRHLGPDCSISPQTYQAALHASGAVLDAVSQVAEQKLNNAFCAVRPPGHHAESQEAMGFCYFNNVAVAGEFLVNQMGFERVLIFDFDVHHGNGTQHSFEERSDIFYSSIHQDPRTSYPGTGFASERGKGEGTGYTLNCPMPPFSTDEAYLGMFESTILPAFHVYNPDFIILSAGFDAHKDDPLAQEALTVNGFDRILRGMKNLAEQCADGRMVSVLEGGYHYQALAECIQSHLGILLESPQ